MSSQKNASRQARNIHPFVVEFVKFTSGFALVIAVSLLLLRATGTSI